MEDPDDVPAYATNGDAEAAVPLLQPSSSARARPADAAAGSSFWVAMFAMTKVVIGAGMMAIPRGYYLMGSLPGTLMLLSVAYLTYWTKAVLVDGSAATGCATYASLARATCGRGAALAVQLAVWAFCFGFMVIYLVVIGDILAGSAGQCNGLLCELLGLQLDRRLVIAAVALLVCAPALTNKSVEALAAFNALGVFAVVLLGAAVAGLAAAAMVQGRGHKVPLWPQWGAFGKGGLEEFMGLAGVVPVVLSCYVGHQNLHSIMPLVKPYTPDRMKAIVAWALTAAAATFLLLALGGTVAFGDALEVNLLSNMYTEGMAPLVGLPTAQALNVLVRGSYLVCLLGSFMLFMFPLRTTLAEVLARDGSGSRSSSGGSRGSSNGRGGEDSSDMAAGSRQGRVASDDCAYSMAAGTDTLAAAGTEEAAATLIAGSKADRLVSQHFYVLTYGLLLLVAAAAALVPNIWAALSLVGDVASTTEGFIVPALIALAMLGWWGSTIGSFNSAAGKGRSRLNLGSTHRERSRHKAGRWGTLAKACIAIFVLLLGTALFVNGILQHILVL